nr:ADP-ribosylglycohydrolase family protein [Ruminococcus sp.]
VTEAAADAVKTMQELFPNAVHIGEFVDITQRALDLAKSDMSDVDAIHSLGEGWVAEETLAIAVFCALRYENDFDKAIIAAVNHNGDSDSTGAVTGNILGAYLGFDNIPEKYKTNLELYDTIIEIADDLYNDCKMSEFGKIYDPVWDRKYIRAIYPFIK